MLVVTNDLYMRRPGVLHPNDQEVLSHGKTVISGAEMLAMSKRGELDKDEIKKIKKLAPEADGLITIKAEDVPALGKMAMEADAVLNRQARRLVTVKRADFIHGLRCMKHYSWRMVAQTCYASWPAADWAPASNQIMGTALCERAAYVLGEDPHQEPWNDC